MYTFADCTNLKKINLPINLKKISLNAFENCSSLNSLEIPEGVEKI